MNKYFKVFLKTSLTEEQHEILGEIRIRRKGKASLCPCKQHKFHLRKPPKSNLMLERQ